MGWALMLCCNADGLAHSAQAAEVMQLHHADKNTVRGDFNLSPKGFLRAIAMAWLIPGCFGNPKTINSFYVNPDTSKNTRSDQSAAPLGVARGVSRRSPSASASS